MSSEWLRISTKHKPSIQVFCISCKHEIRSASSRNVSPLYLFGMEDVPYRLVPVITLSIHASRDKQNLDLIQKSVSTGRTTIPPSHEEL